MFSVFNSDEEDSYSDFFPIIPANLMSVKEILNMDHLPRHRTWWDIRTQKMLHITTHNNIYINAIHFNKQSFLFLFPTTVQFTTSMCIYEQKQEQNTINLLITSWLKEETELSIDLDSKKGKYLIY